MERNVVFYPAWDKRNPDVSKNFGKNWRFTIIKHLEMK